MVEVTGLPAPAREVTPARAAAGGAVPAVVPRRKVLVFRAAGEWFALGLERVREVCPRAPATRVPRAPAPVLGIMNLRGRVVTLVDLARCLALPADGSAGAHVVLLDLGDPDLAVGLVADRIDQVVDLQPETALGSPASAGEGEGEASAAPAGPEGPERGAAGAASDLADIEGRAVTLLDPVRVLAQALPGVGREQTGDGG